MGAVEGSPYRPRLEGQYSKLKSAFYEAEEILDDVEYYRLEKKIQDDRIKSEVAGPSHRLKQIWSAVAKSSPLKDQESGMSKVKLKKKLDRIEEVINDACKVLELMNLPSISGAHQSQGAAANSRGSVTTSRPLSKVIGRDEDCDKIVTMLHEKEEDGQPGISSALCYSVVGIHGIGGSGKSTLAQLVCACEKKDDHFDLVMWVHVSQDFTVRTIFMEIFEAATGTLCPEFKNSDTLQDKLEEKLRGKRFLLVLDDVWYNIRDVKQSENLQQILSPLKAGEAGSKILVTSRTEDALLALGAVKQRCIPMSVLDEDVFWNLFMHYALHGVHLDDHARIILGDIGKEIAKKLKGSPLAARIVGGQLRIRKNVEFWRSVRDRDLLNETMGALWWSYHHLHEQVKRCFAYCSLFPQRHCLERHELVKLWAAEGFARCTNGGEEMEDVCQEYFDELVSASFLQLRAKEKPDEDYYLVHDMLHDLAEKAAGSDCFRIENSWKLQGKCPAVEVPPNVRHVFVETYDEELITKNICKLDNLHTLIIYSQGGRETVGEQALKCMFARLRKLRVLTITTRNAGMASFLSSDVPIPACIGQLRHLRYLAFGTGTGERLGISLAVQATLSKLYHMQVLDFRGIKEVVFSSCEDLINLRHLVVYQADLGIPSIHRLTSLQTMIAFNVRKEQGYELRQLRNLNKLRGELCIRGLEKVESKVEAIGANLADKEGLRTLKLSWWCGLASLNVDEASQEVQAEVLEGLCPPKDLTSLSIAYYKGQRYPSWMHSGGPKHVKHLLLDGCSLKPGPELGRFCTHLHELIIWSCGWDALPDYMEHLTSLQRLDMSFCVNIRSLPALPQSLEHFSLKCCRALSMSSCSMDHLTSLQSLKISSCNSIQSLPTLPRSIKEFKMSTENEVLVSSCKTAGDPDWQKIKHIPYALIVCLLAGEYFKGPHYVMKMGVVQDPEQMGSEADGIFFLR
uniref:Uncharacterized protein n=1 Tax=Avena sativa TaxID=4498 RepID=A0ACD6AFH3_AVESA